MSAPHDTLGIIAGAGHLPTQLVQACRAQNRPFFVLALEHITDPAWLTDIPHRTVRLGAVGDALAALREANVHEVVIAGKVERPSLSSLRPDSTGARMLAFMGKSFFAGDDSVLRSVISFLEREGLCVISAQQVMTSLLAPVGVLGHHAPGPQDLADIALGMKVVKLLGQLDIGQAAVVEHGYVLGVEAAEGTERLIERCRSLKREPHGGVLVKACKPQQEKRVDLPSMGEETLRQIHAAGFSGVAVESGASLIIDKHAVAEAADQLGLFVVGVTYDG